jgi:hypothetical protein
MLPRNYEPTVGDLLWLGPTRWHCSYSDDQRFNLIVQIFDARANGEGRQFNIKTLDENGAIKWLSSTGLRSNRCELICSFESSAKVIKKAAISKKC